MYGMNESSLHWSAVLKTTAPHVPIPQHSHVASSSPPFAVPSLHVVQLSMKAVCKMFSHSVFFSQLVAGQILPVSSVPVHCMVLDHVSCCPELDCLTVYLNMEVIPSKTKEMVKQHVSCFRNTLF